MIKIDEARQGLEVRKYSLMMLRWQMVNGGPI